MPPWLSVLVSPQTAGLIHLQRLLGAQVADVVKNPDTLQGAPHRIIYHELLNPEASKGAPLPSAGSLYEEAQALMFGGADTTGNTLMLGTFYLLESPGLAERMKDELHRAWPVLDRPPSFEDLEKLPFLVRSLLCARPRLTNKQQTAVIQESLRISPGVAAPLLRVVPASGATISGSYIPPNACQQSPYIDSANSPYADHCRLSGARIT
jgi:cytochrome P450